MAFNNISPRVIIEQLAETNRIVTAVEHTIKDRVPATILVTSALQGEGKTLFASAFAACAARRGKHRVVLLDYNWFRPSVNLLFDIVADISAEAFLKDNLVNLVTQSEIEGLDILTAPSGIDFFEKENIQSFHVARKLIEQAKVAYDLIIIDSAGIFPTNRMMMDPVRLSNIVEGVVLVLLPNLIPRQQARKAQKILEIAGANILGVISNHKRDLRK